MIARENIVRVLVGSLFLDDAAYQTLEPLAEEDPAQKACRHCSTG